MERAICWFKPTAHEHLSRAWQMAGILERSGVPIYIVRRKTPATYCTKTKLRYLQFRSQRPGELCEGGNELMANKTLFKSLIGKLVPATNAINEERAPAYALSP